MNSPQTNDAPTLVRDSAFFDAPDGLRLFHRSIVPDAPRAAVAVVHGYGDHSGRYVHVMEHLAEAGFAAHAVDYRGHGQAGGRRGAVHEFREFLDDLSTFLTRVRQQSPGLPLFVLGHSHGGLMSALLFSSEGAPAVDGLLLSSPYFRLRLAPPRLQLLLAQTVGKVLPTLPTRNPLTEDMLTRDEAVKRETAADPLYHHVVTPRWFTESNAAQERVMQQAGRLAVPLLVIQGAEDPIAHPEGAQAYVDAAGSADKKLVSYPGMLHETLNEIGREEPLGEIVRWIEARLPAAVEKNR